VAGQALPLLKQVLENVPAGQVLTLEEGNAR
jgi:hypothetical protein